MPNEPEHLLVAELKHLLVAEGIFCLHQCLAGIEMLGGVLADVLLAELTRSAEAQVEGFILEVGFDAVAQR